MALHSNILGEGKPLVILHGFLGMGDNWKTLGKQFAQDGFEVHLVDQRNHGRSFHHDEFSYEHMVSDLDAYVIEKDIQRFVLLGHSMGGKTAMLYACTFPDKINKLLVADIGPKFYPQHHQTILKGLQDLQHNPAAMQGRKEADQFLGQYIKEVGIRMFLLKNLYWKEPGILGFRMNLPVLIKNIEEIGKPLDPNMKYQGDTLFLKGEQSDYILPEDEEGLYNAFAKAQITQISNAGHWLHAENPKQFYRETKGFISESY